MSSCEFNRERPHGFLIRAHELSPENPVFSGVGNWLASGKYADVHEMDDGRVIRFARCSSYDWLAYSKTLDRIKRRPHPSVVRVFDFGQLGEREHEKFPGERWVYYYTITERLSPITDEDEGEDVCGFIGGILTGEPEPLSYPSVISIKDRARLGRSLRQFPFNHVDLHWGNIMKDGKGNYKLIDLDSLE